MSFDYINKGPISSGAPAAPSLAADIANGVLYTNPSGVWQPVLPAKVASVALTAQTATIAATTLYAVPAGKAGLYEIKFNLALTTVDTTSVSLQFGYKYTDAVGSTVITGPVADITSYNKSTVNTTQDALNGVFVVNAAASTNIQYLTTITNTDGAARYSLNVQLFYLGT